VGAVKETNDHFGGAPLLVRCADIKNTSLFLTDDFIRNALPGVGAVDGFFFDVVEPAVESDVVFEHKFELGFVRGGGAHWSAFVGVENFSIGVENHKADRRLIECGGDVGELWRHVSFGARVTNGESVDKLK